jgi:hypothetical protein
MRGLQTIIMVIKDVKDNKHDSSDNEGVDGGAQSKKAKEYK